MNFLEELIEGTIVDNYKNIILDVKTKDDVVAVFCPETKGMKDIYSRDDKVLIVKTKNPNRKIKYKLYMIDKGEGWIFVNSSYFMRMFIEAFQDGIIKDFEEYSEAKLIPLESSIQYAHFELIKANGDKAYIYIDSIYSKVKESAVFPESINFEDIKMFQEFSNLRSTGFETFIFFIVPRADCVDVKFSWNIDPVAAAKVYDEAENGLKFIAYCCNVDLEGVSLVRKMDIKLVS